MAVISEKPHRNHLFITLLIIFTFSAAGCISQQPEIMKVNPVLDDTPLEGFHGKSEGKFTVIKGGIPEVKESLKDIIIQKAPQRYTFSVDDELNFVVFRGVFGTGGYGIDIDRVEKQENIFTVYATYSDPGEGVGVTEAFTQPVVIIPIGKLTAGDYEARLKVTMVKADADGTRIIRKVIETEKDLSIFNFKVKTPEENPEKGDSGITPPPPLKTSPLEYLSGQAFDESSGILTKIWDAGNFNGFWRDSETGDSTETLGIDQIILNSTHRLIEKHNLIYTTRAVPINYQIYRHTGSAPEGTQGFYQVIGWFGEKYVFFQGNRIAGIIFEQNTTEEKEMTIGGSWELGDGYKVIANSISAKDTGGRQTWITLFKDSNKLADKVMVQQGGPNRFFTYLMNLSDDVPNFIIYYSRVDSLSSTDAAYFKYTWLRSQDTAEIKKGQVYGIMEVVSVNNGVIDLRNKEPIDLAPGSTINLMGNISMQVGNSTTSLQFYPESARRYRTLPSLIDTISATHPILKNYTGMREVAEDYYFKDYIQQCCDEGLKFIISAHPKRGGNEESIVITLQNDFTGKELLKNIEITPEKGEAIAPKIVSSGNWSGFKSQAFMIINSTEEWNNTWQKHASYLSGQKPPLPEIDFTSETIIAVFSGESPEYDVELFNITSEGGIVFINLRRTYPARLSSAQPYFIYRIPKIRENVIFRTLKWEYRMPAGPVLAPAYSASELKANTQILMKYTPPALKDSDIDAIFTEIASIIKTVDGKEYDNVTAKLISESAGLVSQDVWNYEFVFVLEGIRDNKAEWWRMKIYYTTGEKVSIPYPEGPTSGLIFS